MRQKIFVQKIVVFMLTLLCFMSLLTACDENEFNAPNIGSSSGITDLGGGQTQHISLYTNPSQTIKVPLGGTGVFEIIAYVENSVGQPMPDGTSVVWTMTLGVLNKTTDLTQNGVSIVTLTFPTDFTGCSIIIAYSGDVSKSISCCVKEDNDSD